MTENEFTAKTVEEAVEEGLKALGLTREEAEVTVLEEGKKGLFKSVKAKVKVSKKRTDGERAQEFLEGLFSIMGIPATNELEEDEEHTKINVIATNSYAVIGHRGEILDALQALAGAVANIGREEYKRVVVDCENYREKREETLKRLANKLAEKAVRTGRKVSLEPMSPYERRVIHAALADRTDVKTESEGKEPARYIVVVPENLRPERFDRRGGRNFSRDNRRGGYNRDRREGYNREGGYNNREGGYNRDRRERDGKPYERRERRERPAQSARPAKRTPYFGTFLGNSNDLNKNEENKDE